MHTEIDPISSPNPLMQWSLFRRFYFVPLALSLIDTNYPELWQRRHSPVASVIRSSLGSSYLMSSAHKSCVLLCQPSEAEARKTKLCNVDNNMKLMAAAALAPPGWGDTPETQSPLEGRLRLLSSAEQCTVGQVWSLAMPAALTPERGVATSECRSNNIPNVQFLLTNYTEWRNVTRGWIIFMNHWRILVHVHCQQAETFCKMYCFGKKMTWIMAEWV